MSLALRRSPWMRVESGRMANTEAGQASNKTGEIVEAMARVSMPSRVSMTTPDWPRVQSCVRSVVSVIVAKAGISG